MTSLNDSEAGFLAKVKIKQEKISPPASPTKRDRTNEPKAQSTDLNIKVEVTNEDEIGKEKKILQEPLKSSSELLAELFKVFNSVPPETLESKHKKSKKKHKKHKKKQKKRGRSSSDEDEDGDDHDDDNRKTAHKRKKRKRSKSSKSQDDECTDQKKEKLEVQKEKPSKSDRHAHRKHKKSKKDDAKQNSDLDIEEYEKQLLETTSSKNPTKDDNPSTSKRGKIIIKDLKHSSVYAETVSQAVANEKSKLERYEEGEISESISSRSSSISLSDEETYLKNRDRYYSHGSSYYGSSSSYRDRYNDRFDRDRRIRDGGRNYRSRSDRSRRSRSRSRRRDNSENRIDKKRLLEIARKNAILMFKSGMLPGVQHMAPEAKERILTKMRYGGKSVEELTEFCKKLSNGESSGYLSNISDDSEHDGEGNEKAFNHPFVLKDRGPIVMNIKNSTPIPPKTAEQTKAILLQFPVSSGQHHRLNESEWVPVPPKKAKLAKSIAKPIEESELQPVEVPTPQILSPPPPPPLPPPEQVPSITDTTEKSNVFDTMASNQDIDVTSIISNRLNAMRKLQDNPQDHDALATMFRTQRDMSAWANSKFIPGQFTGSTGANILTPRELTAGVQAWAKRDQMITTTPVSGGMGMHILQKMGWKPGEGLGKERNGSLQPLLLEVKLDKKGLLANEEDQTQAGQAKRKRPANVAQAKLSMENKHPVSLLGELAAKRKWLAPLYEQEYEGGPHHSRQFFFKNDMISANNNAKSWANLYNEKCGNMNQVKYFGLDQNDIASARNNAMLSANYHCIQNTGNVRQGLSIGSDYIQMNKICDNISNFNHAHVEKNRKEEISATIKAIRKANTDKINQSNQTPRSKPLTQPKPKYIPNSRAKKKGEPPWWNENLKQLWTIKQTSQQINNKLKTRRTQDDLKEASRVLKREITKAKRVLAESLNQNVSKDNMDEKDFTSQTIT